jgi:hypothetical protein
MSSSLQSPGLCQCMEIPFSFGRTKSGSSNSLSLYGTCSPRAKWEALVEFQAKANSPELLLAAGRSWHLDDADPAMPALPTIQRIADSRLQEHVATRLLFQGDPPRLGISLMPHNLLGALWLRFSAAVGALKTFNKCPQCGAPFELSRDPQTGKRRDARFCSARCGVGHYPTTAGGRSRRGD